jgi:hypothetical protein
MQTFTEKRPTDIERHRAAEEFRRLSKIRARLGWSANARDQQEHQRLGSELMKLYIALNPKAAYRVWDDFDLVMRGKATR